MVMDGAKDLLLGLVEMKQSIIPNGFRCVFATKRGDILTEYVG